MNILLLGSGGREHAFARALSISKKCRKLFIAPGNAGTSQHGINVDLSLQNFAAIKELVMKENIDMVVVGPEDPLVNGIVDFFRAEPELKSIPVIGPDAAGAQLEGSKSFSKDFMRRHNIPTAAYRSFKANEIQEAETFLKILNPPYVLKADGLAAGKGVVISQTYVEARTALHEMLEDQKFGKASETVVIEEFLSGIEVSVFVLTDGKNYMLLPEAKDYKRIGEGDTGLNTGGMGAVSPVPFVNDTFLQKVKERIIQPTINGLIKENIDYRGFIFIGLMNVAGDPFVIEYNCRMGDPETEAVLPRIKNDFADLMEKVALQQLHTVEPDYDVRTAATVVLVSGGYPGDYERNIPVEGLDKSFDSLVFYAGTTRSGDDVLTNGGRVFAITSLADNLEEALRKSFDTAGMISYKGKYYRRDIGQDLLPARNTAQ
jgi:phosphoribosylamine--glycine ligase